MLFGEPEKLDNPLITAFLVLCRVRNQWTEMGHFHTSTPFLNRIFPPATVGCNSDTVVSAAANELDQHLMFKFFDAMSTRFRPSKDQDTRAEFRQGRFIHDSSAKLFRDDEVYQHCGKSASAVRKNQEILCTMFAELFPIMWGTKSKLDADYKYDVGLWDFLHVGGLTETMEAMEEIWKADLDNKDDKNPKYNRSHFFYGDSAGSALTRDEMYTRTRTDLISMLCLSDMCERTTKKGARDQSRLTPAV